MTATRDRAPLLARSLPVPRPRRATPHGAEDGVRLLVIDIYARLSKNPDTEDLEKIERQIADCRKLIEANPLWTVGEIHIDNSLSAWKLTVRRRGWENLFARLESGAADGVAVWHTDRLVRQPWDLELLFRIGAEGGLTIASCYGTWDPSDEDHRAMLRVQAMMAEKSSAAKSRRIKRTRKAAREAGNVARLGGGRLFGFHGNDASAWGINPETGKRKAPRDGSSLPVLDVQVRAERDAIRRGSEAVASGLPMAGVVRAWNAAKLQTVNGEKWTSVSVRAVLLRPRNAGLIESKGAVVGRTGDAIIDEDLFNRVRAVFAARRRGRPASGKYVGSGKVYCGNCGHTMGGRPASNHRDGTPRTQYMCKKDSGGCGTVAIDGRGLDEWLRGFTIERLADPRHSQAISARVAATADRLSEIEDALRADYATVAALGERLGRLEITLDTFDAANRPLKARIDTLETERGTLQAAQEQPVTDVDGDADAIAAEWDNGTPEERRALLTSALRGVRATVAPATTRGVFDPSRVQARPLAVA